MLLPAAGSISEPAAFFGKLQLQCFSETPPGIEVTATVLNVNVGRKEGLMVGREEMRSRFLPKIAGLVSAGSISLADAVADFGFSEEEIRAVM